MSQKHLFKFQTENDYKTAKRNNLIVPNISMVVEDGDTHINSKFVPRELAEAGDIIVYHIEENGEKTVKYMKPQAYDANDGYWIPDAIVVVPYSHTDDGTVRAMGLKYASTITPSEGTEAKRTSDYITFGATAEIQNAKQYNNYVSFTSIQGQTIEDEIALQDIFRIVTAGSPIDTLPEMEGGNENVLNPFDTETRYGYNRDVTNYLPSPFNNDGSKSDAYHSTGAFSDFASNNPLGDMDGDKNTLTILKNLNQNYLEESLYAETLDNQQTKTVDDVVINLFPLASACARYSSVLKPCVFDTSKTIEENIKTMPWYMPSAGELGYMRSRIAKICYSIDKIKSSGMIHDPMPVQVLISSTTGFSAEKNGYGIVCVDSTYQMHSGIWYFGQVPVLQTDFGSVFPFCKF